MIQPNGGKAATPYIYILHFVSVLDVNLKYVTDQNNEILFLSIQLSCRFRVDVQQVTTLLSRT
jgi:hypothetical protein